MIIVLLIIVMIGPPILFLSLGKQTNDAQRAKLFYIIAVAYLIVGFGVCGTIINGL
jgi:hypothetical protein